MSLDTVELIMDFEEKFKINIPDEEAAKMATVREAAEGILKYIQLREPERDLFGEVLGRIRVALEKIGIRPGELGPETRLRTIFSGEDVKSQWQQFENALGLQIPGLTLTDLGEAGAPRDEPRERKLFGIKIPSYSFYQRPDPPFLENDVGRLVDCICGLNHEQLVDFDHLTSRYEVMVGVMVITSDKSGVEITSIFRDSSFTNDLGMD
jgi:hypothetical protein